MKYYASEVRRIVDCIRYYAKRYATTWHATVLRDMLRYYETRYATTRSNMQIERTIFDKYVMSHVMLTYDLSQHSKRNIYSKTQYLT